MTSPPASEFHEAFAYSVAAADDTAVITGVGENCGVDGSVCGAAYVFRFSGSTWGEPQKLTPATRASVDFGWSVAIDADNVIVGAGGAYCGSGERCSAAYVFALGPDCNANGEADFCDIRDGSSGDADSDGVPDECEVITAALDIKPGACPNTFNPTSRGVLPVAVVGTPTFDVTQIDTDSLVLRRSDGVGGSVRPLSGPPGPGIHFEDVATPFSGPECGCNELGPDGIEDLALKFSTPEMVASLELASLPAGASVALTATGVMHDGTPFEASDCILLIGRSITRRRVKGVNETLRTSNPVSHSRHSETIPTPVGGVDPKE